MTMIPEILMAGLAFAAFAAVALLAAQAFYGAGERLPDGPKPSSPPTRLLIGLAAALGMMCVYHNVFSPPQLAMIVATTALMLAIWYVDVVRGIIPDALTLFPLAVLILSELISGQHLNGGQSLPIWAVAVIGAVVAGLPFAIFAWRTKGLGMGWGDVKLAALGGALIGAELALLSYAVASIASVIIAKLRHTDREPIAFGPYLASAIVVPICLNVHFS